MDFNEKPKDINTLIDETDASFGWSIENKYTNGEATPSFKEWLSGYQDVNINEETLPLLREIYDTYIYNVPLPKDSDVENYISWLESRKLDFESKYENFRLRLEQGQAQPMNFNPENGEIESEDTYNDSINQVKNKITILQKNRASNRN